MEFSFMQKILFIHTTNTQEQGILNIIFLGRDKKKKLNLGDVSPQIKISGGPPVVPTFWNPPNY